MTAGAGGAGLDNWLLALGYGLRVNPLWRLALTDAENGVRGTQASVTGTASSDVTCCCQALEKGKGQKSSGELASLQKTGLF